VDGVELLEVVDGVELEVEPVVELYVEPLAPRDPEVVPEAVPLPDSEPEVVPLALVVALVPLFIEEPDTPVLVEVLDEGAVP
jgi:hypothetical protein